MCWGWGQKRKSGEIAVVFQRAMRFALAEKQVASEKPRKSGH